MSTHLSNAEFLAQFDPNHVSDAILALEEVLIVQKLENLREQQAMLTREKEAVSGGDDWHDGAFRATDNEAKVVTEQAGRLTAYLGALIVDTPEADERRATLGSRVTLNQAGSVYDIQIVGVPLLHDAAELGDDVDLCSIESPVAKHVIGKEVGHVALISMAGKMRSVEILAIDQQFMKEILDEEIAS